MERIYIDEGGLGALLAKERRRRTEVEMGEGLDELSKLLLPLALSLARLSARNAVEETA